MAAGVDLPTDPPAWKQLVLPRSGAVPAYGRRKRAAGAGYPSAANPEAGGADLLCCNASPPNRGNWICPQSSGG